PRRRGTFLVLPARLRKPWLRLLPRRRGAHGSPIAARWPKGATLCAAAVGLHGAPAVSPLRVQKYGGTSVASPSQLLSVASRVARCRRAGDELVVVVSAMGETTDHLIDLARQVHPEPPQRELDMLLTTGERISMALLAMALRGEGIEA